jgi:CDP-diacylglycerol--glycerol-3-phosphate 3-phosphatidyltransferase
VTAAQRWAALHHGIEPDSVPLLPAWLRLMWRLARPLTALRIPPVAVTAAGVALAAAAAVVVASHPWLGGAAVVLAAVCDGLDGAVAVVADRATAWGAIADAIADRLSDVAFAAVLWRCGAPAWLAALCGVLAVGVDGARRWRRVPARITVGERPTWTICAALACGSAAVTTTSWPVLVCAAVWVAAGATALVQLLR